MWKRKLFRVLVVSLILLGTFLSSVFSSVTNSASIANTGKISTKQVYAKSGSSADIQAAVDAVAAAGGGTVYVPAGNFSFHIPPDRYGINNRQAGVIVQGGVNVIGAGIGQTILTGIDYAGDCRMFLLDGSNNKPIRISGISFKGLVVDENTNCISGGIDETGVRDFRIDHCSFEDFAGFGVGTTNNYVHNPTGNCGVIDHCTFDNPYKAVWEARGDRAMWGYGIIVGGNGQGSWDPDWKQFFGQYRHDIIYIEDCSFTRCRHCIAGNSQDSAFYVVRFCNLTEMMPRTYGSYVDVHGGSQGVEAYGNTVINSGATDGTGIAPRGGFSLIYNNTVKDIPGAGAGIKLVNDQSISTYRLNGAWVWNNTFVNVTTPFDTAPNAFPIRENIEYFLRAPTQAQDGFTYTPYPYPHPLALETTP